MVGPVAELGRQSESGVRLVHASPLRRPRDDQGIVVALMVRAMCTIAQQLILLFVQRRYGLSKSRGSRGVERQAGRYKKRMRWPCALHGADDDEIETDGDQRPPTRRQSRRLTNDEDKDEGVGLHSGRRKRGSFGAALGKLNEVDG